VTTLPRLEFEMPLAGVEAIPSIETAQDSRACYPPYLFTVFGFVGKGKDPEFLERADTGGFLGRQTNENQVPSLRLSPSHQYLSRSAKF
jgi:hypothetical protein